MARRTMPLDHPPIRSRTASQVSSPNAAEYAREALVWIRSLASDWEDEHERSEGPAPGPPTRRRPPAS